MARRTWVKRTERGGCDPGPGSEIGRLSDRDQVERAMPARQRQGPHPARRLRTPRSPPRRDPGRRPGAAGSGRRVPPPCGRSADCGSHHTWPRCGGRRRPPRRSPVPGAAPPARGPLDRCADADPSRSAAGVDVVGAHSDRSPRPWPGRAPGAEDRRPTVPCGRPPGWSLPAPPRGAGKARSGSARGG